MATGHAALHAQTAVSGAQSVQQLYEDVNFEAAITTGNRLLRENAAALSPDALIIIHKYLAFAHFNMGNTDSARVHFLSLLSLRPDIGFSPAEASPKILDFFAQLKNEYQTLTPESGSAGFTRYVVARDLRASAAWRSAILPGWGQFHKGQTGRMVVLGGGFWGSLGATVAAYLKEQDEKDAYNAATDPATISSRYAAYDRWHKRRQVLTLVTAGFWLLNIIDAGWSSYPAATVSAAGDGFQFALKIPL